MGTLAEPRMLERVIVHVDMDAFFAAVEQRDRPELQGVAVVVGADPKGGRGRGVVATCSYEARRFGIRSAMPISEAWRRCPTAAYLPVRMEAYAQASEAVFRVIEEFTPDVEPVSIDEAFLDVSRSLHLFGTKRTLGERRRARIEGETHLTASIGVAPCFEPRQRQLSLFGGAPREAEREAKQRLLADAVARIKTRFGPGALHQGTTLDRPEEGE